MSVSNVRKFALQLSGVVTALTLLCACAGWAGEDAPKPSENVKLDAKATALLRDTISYLNNTKSYSTTLTFSQQIALGLGKKQEATSKYDITVERPNKMAMVIRDGKLRCAVLSDGKTLCVYTPPIKKYAQREAPKTLADLFDIDEMQVVRQDLSNLLFLDQMNLKDAFDKIMEGVLSVKMEAPEEISGVQTNKIHFVEDGAEWDMWVQTGDQPLLRKVAVYFEKDVQSDGAPAKAKVTMSAMFDDWKINPDLPADRFVFVPPADAKKVDSFMQKPEAAGGEYDPKLKGLPAPALAAALLEGGKFDLAAEKGKNVVVLDFWATWCGPCRMAMPIVSSVVASYKGKGVVGYAVNLGEDIEKLKEFKKATPELTLPILMDTDNKISEAYRVQPIPMTVIIDKEGVVQVVHLGIPRNTEMLRTMLVNDIDNVLAGKATEEKKPEEKKPDEKKPESSGPKAPEKGDEDHEKAAK